MSARVRAITGVVIMAALLILYFVFAGVRAVALIVSATPVAVIMGVALLVLPLIGAWALGREVYFGARATALVDRLAADDDLPDDLGDAGPTGKPDREVAEAVFAKYKAAAEAEPESWRAWLRLAIVYDASGDRARARRATRHAICFERAARRGAAGAA